jgi:hypothetical protein
LSVAETLNVTTAPLELVASATMVDGTWMVGASPTAIGVRTASRRTSNDPMSAARFIGAFLLLLQPHELRDARCRLAINPGCDHTLPLNRTNRSRGLKACV